MSIPPLPQRSSPSTGRRLSLSDSIRRTSRLLNVKRYGIFSLTTKDWVYTQPRWNDWMPVNCVFKTKRAAARCIKDDLVHEKDYEVREYKR